MNPVRKAIIPIAGLGSRFLPATKCIPKEMLPLYDKPVIEHIVRELALAGVEEVIFVVPPEGSVTPSHFFRNEWLESELRKKGKVSLAENIRSLSRLVKVATVVQQEPLGDGDAILQAEDLIGEEYFFVFFGDEIIDAPLSAAVQLLQEKISGDGVLGLQEVPREETKKFGIITLGGSDHEGRHGISGFVEKPDPEKAPSTLALLGKNLCSPRIFRALRESPTGNGGELRLIDGFSELLRQGGQFFGKILEGNRFDVGNPQGLLEASLHFSQKTKYPE